MPQFEFKDQIENISIVEWAYMQYPKVAAMRSNPSLIIIAKNNRLRNMFWISLRNKKEGNEEI